MRLSKLYPALLLLFTTPALASIDQAINDGFKPYAKALSEFVFYSVPVGGTQVPIIVVALVGCGLFFTVYLGFINLRGFRHAVKIVKGDFEDPNDPGEVSHFQALTTAVSGTVGVGNVAHVAIVISIGGPGAAFWMIVAGFLGMSSKFAECTLGVKYRNEAPDGTTFGGPMFYLEKGLAELNKPRLGKVMAYYYAVCIVIGTLGIGCMFQSNQAYSQFVNTTGAEASFFADKAWMVGIVLAVLTATVIVGGIKSIAAVTSRLVPFMAGLYVITALIVIAANYDKLGYAFSAIITGAFSPDGVAGGMIGVLILGFRRAAFSNEAGLGSSSIAHAAVRTKEPVTEGYVAMLEPFIDTVVICTITALVILVTIYEPGVTNAGGISGVELTSSAFGSVISWFPYVLTVVIILFAFSTMVSWSYYGLAGWVFLFGDKTSTKLIYNLIFCVFVVIGCAIKLDAVLDFSDSMIFAMALANIIGIIIMAPIVKQEIRGYWERRADNQAGLPIRR
ncbi:MAG: alanine:cation symporter family protein [Arenicella sp.]|nr:alanine:cation symporter family protein [Arenicella sp.]